jgi:xanthine dehydrogenase accessory factor
LEIGAETTEEIAISIIREIIKLSKETKLIKGKQLNR